MRKTDKMVCVGKKSGYDVWRVVFEQNNRYYVKWNKQIIDVTKDIEENNYTYASSIR